MKMWSRVSLLSLAFIATIALKGQLADANVLFRFSLAFGDNSDTSAEADSDELFNKTITFDNNHLTIKNNLDSTDVKEEVVVTESPNDSQLSPRTTTLDEFAWRQKFWNKMNEIHTAVTKLKQEILNIEERSEFLQQKLNKIYIYLYVKEPSLSGVDVTLAHYTNYVVFVDELKEPKDGVNNMEHTIDYNFLKLALEKYQIIKLQDDVTEQMATLKDLWQEYNKTKVVKVDV